MCTVKRIAIVAAVVAVGGMVAAGYGVFVSSAPIMAAGGVAALAGLQCAMNAHLALLRQRFAIQG